MLSKLGALDTAEATDYLTSTLNSYKMGAEEAAGVVDKLVAVDNVAATSSGELATALKYSAATAQEAGVSLVQLISYIGVVSSTTRQSAESIGQAFKTMFTRMQDIKAGKIDEDGLGINNVESALARVNIKLRDSKTEFRNMSDVLEELSGKWNSLSETEQANLAKSIAGVRQANMFNVLMQNMNRALELQQVQMNSTGLAADRYKIYLESVEAAQNKMTASWEKMWTKTMSSGAIKSFYEMATGVLNLVSALGGLGYVLGIVAVAVGTLYRAQLLAYGKDAVKTIVAGIDAIRIAWELYTTGVEGGLTATYALEVALEGFKLLNPELLVIGVALAAIIGTLGYLSGAEERAAETTRALAQNVSDLDAKVSKSNADLTSIKSLGEEFESLRKQTFLTTEEQKRLIEVQNQLKELIPDLAGKYDDEGNYMVSESVHLKNLIDLKKEEAQLDKEKLERAAAAQIKDSIGTYEAAEQKLKALIAQRKALFELKGPSSIQGGLAIQGIDEQIKATRVANDQMRLDIQNTFYKLSDLDKVAYAAYSNIFDGAKAAWHEFDDWKEANTTPVIPETPANTPESQKAFDDILKMTVDMLKQKANAEKDALQKSIDNINAETNALKDALKERHNAETQEFNSRKQQLKDEFDAFKESMDAQKRALQDRFDAQKRGFADRKQNLKDELDNYKAQIDAQKALLQAKQEEINFNRQLADKQKSLAEVQAKLAELQFDNSAEGIAAKKLLEEQAANFQKDIDESQADRKIALEQKILDNQKQAAQDAYDLKVRGVEQEEQAAQRIYELNVRKIEDNMRAAQAAYDANVRAVEDAQKTADAKYEIEVKKLDDTNKLLIADYQKKIDDLNTYLGQAGVIEQDARNALKENADSLYGELVAWNKTYGDGIIENVYNTWKLATGALLEYKAAQDLLDINNSASGAGNGWYPGASGVPFHHSGIDSGNAGGKKNDEILSMLTKDEIIFTPNQLNNMLKNLIKLPASTSSRMGENGGINISMPINVAGNLDKDIIPDLNKLVERVVDKINDNMKSRGFLRTTSSTSI